MLQTTGKALPAFVYFFVVAVKDSAQSMVATYSAKHVVVKSPSRRGSNCLFLYKAYFSFVQCLWC